MHCCKGQDPRKITRATGASSVTSLANVEGEESFEASLLCEAKTVTEARTSDEEHLLIEVRNPENKLREILHRFVQGRKVCSAAWVTLLGDGEEHP